MNFSKARVGSSSLHVQLGWKVEMAGTSVSYYPRIAVGVPTEHGKFVGGLPCERET